MDTSFCEFVNMQLYDIHTFEYQGFACEITENRQEDDQHGESYHCFRDTTHCGLWRFQAETSNNSH